MSALMHLNKNVRMATVLATVLFVSWNSGATAGDQVKVDPQCPISISPGQTLNIELKLTNTTQTVTLTYNGVTYPMSTGQTFNIAKTGLIAHLGHLNVVGPYVIPLTLALPPQPTLVLDPNNPFTNPTADLQSTTTTGYMSCLLYTSDAADE